MAMYGKSYWQSAKATWKLIKAKNLKAVINDDFLSTVLHLTSFVLSFIAGILMTVWAFLVVDEQIGTTPKIIFCDSTAAVCGVVFETFGACIRSGMKTIFACLAMDPAALQRTKPELYNAIAEKYPEITIPAF